MSSGPDTATGSPARSVVAPDLLSRWIRCVAIPDWCSVSTCRSRSCFAVETRPEPRSTGGTYGRSCSYRTAIPARSYGLTAAYGLPRTLKREDVKARGAFTAGLDQRRVHRRLRLDPCGGLHRLGAPARSGPAPTGTASLAAAASWFVRSQPGCEAAGRDRGAAPGPCSVWLAAWLRERHGLCDDPDRGDGPRFGRRQEETPSRWARRTSQPSYL